MALYGAIAEAPTARGRGRRGLALWAGSTTLAGSNPTSITTPFKSVISVHLDTKNTTAPAAAVTLSYDVPTSAANRVDVYQWKPSAAGTTTLVAGTGSDTFSYLVTGLL